MCLSTPSPIWTWTYPMSSWSGPLASVETTRPLALNCLHLVRGERERESEERREGGNIKQISLCFSLSLMYRVPLPISLSSSSSSSDSGRLLGCLSPLSHPILAGVCVCDQQTTAYQCMKPLSNWPVIGHYSNHSLCGGLQTSTATRTKWLWCFYRAFLFFKQHPDFYLPLPPPLSLSLSLFLSHQINQREQETVTVSYSCQQAGTSHSSTLSLATRTSLNHLLPNCRYLIQFGAESCLLNTPPGPSESAPVISKGKLLHLSLSLYSQGRFQCDSGG